MKMFANTNCKEKKNLLMAAHTLQYIDKILNYQSDIIQNNICRQSIYRHMAVSEGKYPLRGEIIDPVSKI